MSKASPSPLKPVVWVGSSREDLRDFPDEVCDGIGLALYDAQKGEKNASAKPLRGFGGASVVEIVEEFDGDTYRCVYTTKLAGVIYVLHVFQKKSTRGIATPKHVIELIRQRLRSAEAEHEKEAD